MSLCCPFLTTSLPTYQSRKSNYRSPIKKSDPIRPTYLTYKRKLIQTNTWKLLLQQPMPCVSIPTCVNSKPLEYKYILSTWKALTCFNAASVHMVSSPLAWCHRALRPHTSPPQAADWTTWFFKAMENFMSKEVTMHMSILLSLCREHTWPSSQPNPISLPSYSRRPLYPKIYKESRVVRFWRVRSSRFCVRPKSLSWAWCKIRESMKHYPLHAM